MNNLIIKKNFDQLLLKNWTEIINFQKLLAFVLQHARNSELNKIKVTKIPDKNTEIKLSRFTLESDGFVIWAEFNWRNQEELISGTSELHLSNLGVLTHRTTIGDILAT